MTCPRAYFLGAGVVIALDELAYVGVADDTNGEPCVDLVFRGGNRKYVPCADRREQKRAVKHLVAAMKEHARASGAWRWCDEKAMEPPE